VNFDTKKFYQFCKHLKIESKEQGMITLGETLLGTQTYVIDEVAKGLKRRGSLLCGSQRQAARDNHD
jgi:hypothetical protein